jgi:hypothetical protein
MAMRVLYAKMDKLVDKKILERLLPRAARASAADAQVRVIGIFAIARYETGEKYIRERRARGGH